MNNKQLKRLMCLGLLVIFTGGVISGCSPAMRKKFLRKKKEEVENSVIPVLEPIDYPNQMEDAKTRYDYFYTLLKVWQKDALVLIDDEHSKKQIVYTISQIKVQLKELDKIIGGESQKKIDEAIKAVDGVLAYYDKPASFCNRDIIRKSLQRLTDSVINPLAYKNIKDDLRE